MIIKLLTFSSGNYDAKQNYGEFVPNIFLALQEDKI